MSLGNLPHNSASYFRPLAESLFVVFPGIFAPFIESPLPPASHLKTISQTSRPKCPACAAPQKAATHSVCVARRAHCGGGTAEERGASPAAARGRSCWGRAPGAPQPDLPERRVP